MDLTLEVISPSMADVLERILELAVFEIAKVKPHSKYSSLFKYLHTDRFAKKHRIHESLQSGFMNDNVIRNEWPISQQNAFA